MVLVKLEQGVLEGERVNAVTGGGFFYSFKGIPYAAPPIGKLRFKEPQPALPWRTVRKATEHGPNCPQYNIFTKKMVPGNEDCLYLNVYTPDVNPPLPLPVMFFIHGGALRSGSGDDDHYGPDFLVSHGVILVTINYRLEALGFLCLDTKEVPGNAGLKDQVAALRWVSENISKFGGDSKNITIFGESAGGTCVALHLLSPLTEGLFQRAIIMSGSPFCEWSIPFQPARRAFTLGEQLGFVTDDPDKLLDFFQNVPTESLVNTNPCILTCEEIVGNLLKFNNFTWVVENNLGQEAFLTENPEEALKNGNAHNVEVIIGHTKEECVVGLLFWPEIEKFYQKYYKEIYVPRQILYNTTSMKILQTADIIKKHFFKADVNIQNQMKEIVRLWSECSFDYPIQKFANLLAKTEKQKIYFYRFSCVSERNVYGALGNEFDIDSASHLDDLQYLFHAKSLNIPLDKNSRSFIMIQQFCSLFANFAKYGNPTPDLSLGAIWREYDNTNKPYLEIDEQLTPGSHLNDDVMEFWDEIYNFAGVPY